MTELLKKSYWSTCADVSSCNERNLADPVLSKMATLKAKLRLSDMDDQCLQAKVLKLVDISYGNQNGFSEATELSIEVLSTMTFIQEK